MAVIRLLVVDDDERILALLRDHFSWDGFDVLTALNGRRALTILDETPVDVVLTDVTMPEMDGPTLVRTLRARGDTTPVVLMSGEARGPDLARSVDVAAFVAKPVDLARLTATVRDVRGTSRRLDPSTPHDPGERTWVPPAVTPNPVRA